MAIVTIQNFIICSLVTLASADLHVQGFLAKSPKVHTDAFQHELTGVLSEVLGHGHGVTEDRLKHIHATLLPLFRSLPKNNRGHVSEPIMRYTLRRYFRAAHGWVVKGFEEHGDYAFNATNNSNMGNLQGKVPDFVRSALEQKFAHQGFSLHDMVSMIATLESLAFDEVVRSVAVSFDLNSFGSGAILSGAELKDALRAFLVMEMMEGDGFTFDAQGYATFKKNPASIYPGWAIYEAFLTDISGNDGLARHSISNPFTVKTFAFEDVVRMAGRITEEFGVWSNRFCHDMKDTLSEMDVHETGRVKLSDFYKAAHEGLGSFLEPSEYLKQLGALDESSKYLGPQVIIPNYVTGMSNCISSTMYFSVCCLTECDLIHQHIESEIPDTNGTVSQILRAVESLPAFPIISQEMMNKLEEIATINGGSIPLHGRLFAQWLHFAMPREFPYPHAVGSISPKPPTKDKFETQPASEDEMMHHMEDKCASRDPSPDAGRGMWNYHESIMDFSTSSDTDDAMAAAMFSKVLRVSSQVVILGSLAALVMREGIKVLRTFKGDAKPKEYTV